jgi:O-acetyl-ADP-ribose deacetylase (regulator of RNase III)
MTLERKTEHDDMFACEADAIVCPVNCVGVLGAGLARVFAGKYPHMVTPYEYACGVDQIAIGRVHTISVSEEVDVVCLPTKDHWRGKSELDFIQRGVDALVFEVDRMGWKRVAVPALGCGLGGLDWAEVLPIIEDAFLYSNSRVITFPPR